MRAQIVAALIPLGLAGCGTQADPRLLVNDALRAECPSFTDSQLKSILAAGEESRLAGLTVGDQIVTIPASCTGLTITFEECSQCSAALIAQVYGL